MRPVVATLLLSAALALPAQPRHHPVVFEATVTRIDNRGLSKISCGVAIVYRLAEYTVTVPKTSHLHAGDKVTVEHLACNGEELDNLKPGDHVLVLAERLKHAEKRAWQPDLRGIPIPPSPGTTDSIALPNGTPVLVRYRSDKLPELLPANP
jgi:hypothetical protein